MDSNETSFVSIRVNHNPRVGDNIAAFPWKKRIFYEEILIRSSFNSQCNFEFCEQYQPAATKE